MIVILLQKKELGEELSEKINSMCKKTSKKIQHIEQQQVDIE